MILAIDPGNEKSAWLVYDNRTNAVMDFGICTNAMLLDRLPIMRSRPGVAPERMAIEMVASYGMPVGKTVFETCVWIGRFIEAWQGAWEFVYRLDVKMALCHDSRAKDGNVRQAIIDRFDPTGGGKIPQIGTKVKKGPLYGISKDVWSALGVAITARTE